MNNSRLTKLLTALPEDKQLDLKIHANVATTAKKEVAASPTNKNRKAWKDAETALTAECERLEAWLNEQKDADQPDQFSTIIQATKYLKDQGYKICKTVLADSVKNGLIPRYNGKFDRKTLDLYAENNLKIIETGLTHGDHKKINLQERKLRAEIKIKEAQALKAEKENDILDGKYILKTDHNLEIAAAIGVLESSLKHGYRINVSDFIDCVEGEQKHGDALHRLLCDTLDDEFNKMAKMGAVRVKIS